MLLSLLFSFLLPLNNDNMIAFLRFLIYLQEGVNPSPLGTVISNSTVQVRFRLESDEIGTAPDGRLIVREKQRKIDQDMLSSDEEDGMPENIRMSDQKVFGFARDACEKLIMFHQVALMNNRQEEKGRNRRIAVNPFNGLSH